MLTSSFFSDTVLLCIILVFLVHAYYLKEKGRWFVFDPLNFFWVGVFVIYVMEASDGYDGYVYWYGELAVQNALLWILFGMVFVHFGYYLRVGITLARRAPELPAELAPNALPFISAALVLLGIVGWKIEVDGAGGLQAWAAVPRGGADWENVSGYSTQLASLLTVGVSIFLIYSQLGNRNILLKLCAWTVWVVLLLFFLYLGTRSRTIAVVLIALMAWSLPKGRSPRVGVLAVIFCALLLVTNFQAHYRDHFRNFSFNFHEINWEDVPGNILPGFVSGRDGFSTARKGSEFSITIAVVELVPDKVPYAMGREFIQLFTHPIPRAWWPEKRYPKSESWTPIYLESGASQHWVDYVKVPFLAGPTPGHVASWYYNGGGPGLIVGGVMVGIFLRFLRGLYDRGRRNDSYLLVSYVALPTGFGSVVSHPFNWAYSAPLVLMPLLLFLYLTKNREAAPNGVRK